MNVTTTVEPSALLVFPPSGYKTLCIMSLIVCSIASILSAILIIAMALPLLSRKRRKEYITYNLYLAYLAFPDLIHNVFVLHLILSQHTINLVPETSETDDDGLMWMFIDHPFDHNIYAFCVAANLYTNAFLVFEILSLLQDSSKGKRHDPPSITKVTRHAMISYGLGAFIFLLEYLLDGNLEGNSRRIRILFGLYQAFSFVVVALIPLLALVSACVTIHRQGLVRSTGSMYDGRLRVLVIYFLRIIASYILLWVPASIAYMVYWVSSEINRTKVLAYSLFLFFAGIPAIVTFGLSLTKPDAYTLITNLLKCEYCSHPNTKTTETIRRTEIGSCERPVGELELMDS